MRELRALYSREALAGADVLLTRGSVGGSANNFFIAARPRSDFVMALLRAVADRGHPMLNAGPLLVHWTFARYAGPDRVVLLDRSVTCPCDACGRCAFTADTHIAHLFDSSWHTWLDRAVGAASCNRGPLLLALACAGAAYADFVSRRRWRGDAR